MSKILLILMVLGLFNFAQATDEFESEENASRYSREQTPLNRPATVVVRKNLQTGEVEFATVKESIEKSEGDIDKKLSSLEFSSNDNGQMIGDIDEIDQDNETSSWYFYFYSQPNYSYYPAFYSYRSNYAYGYTPYRISSPYYYRSYNNYGYRCFY